MINVIVFNDSNKYLRGCIMSFRCHEHLGNKTVTKNATKKVRGSEVNGVSSCFLFDINVFLISQCHF